MGRNKFGKFILLGALAGAVTSLFDRSTREQLMYTSRSLISDVRFYSRNPDVVKMKVQEKSEKYKSLYDQLSEDAAYLKEKVDELKELSPQVKGLVVDTKDAFTEAKDEYKTIVSDNSTGEGLGK